MSVLIAAKINDLIVLGADSRLYNSAATKFLSDAGRKISEIAPGVFYAWAGFSQIAQIQAVTAARIASGGVTDLRELADRLDAACSAELQQTLEAVGTVRQQAALHSYVLAGRGGFIGRGFQIQGDKIHMSETDSRSSAFGLFAGVATPADAQTINALAHIPGWWLDGVRGVERIIEILRASSPLIGGPIQLVAIDPSGARWVHRPADLEEVAVPASGTITALVQMISPTITGGNITGSTIQLNLNGTTVTINNAYDSRLLGYPGLRVSNNTYPNRRICIVDDGIWGMDQNNVIRFQLFTDGTLHLFDGGGLERILIDGYNGQIKVNGVSLNVP